MRLAGSIVLLMCLVSVSPAAGRGKDDASTAVGSFYEALASGDRDRVLALLDPGVVIFEQGGAEMSRDDYASQHLDEDIEFSRTTRRKVVDQQAHAQGKFAWVLTTSETSGSFQGKDVSSRNVETMILEKTSQGWRIAHIHWSSHRKS